MFKVAAPRHKGLEGVGTGKAWRQPPPATDFGLVATPTGPLRLWHVASPLTTRQSHPPITRHTQQPAPPAAAVTQHVATIGTIRPPSAHHVPRARAPCLQQRRRDVVEGEHRPVDNNAREREQPERRVEAGGVAQAWRLRGRKRWPHLINDVPAVGQDAPRRPATSNGRVTVG